MKRKGFTLIELLAVVIVLAVIALITTPIILDVVENAKEKSRISSVNSLLDATRLYMSEAMLDDSIDLSGNLLDIINTRVKGTKPDEGEIRIDGNDIGIAVKIDGICYIKDYNEEEIRKTNDEDCTIFKSIEATCYDGEIEIIDDFEINYENCVAMLPNMLQSYNITLSPSELDLTCKNEMKVSGVLDSPAYFKDAMMATYLSGDSTYDILVSSNIIEVKTKKGCQTCFEYEKNIDYDINYDVCMEMLDMEEACKGEKADFEDNDNLQTLKEYINSTSTQEQFSEFINYGLIENIRLTEEAVITNYLCYEGNDKDLPTITDVVIPTTINGIKITEISSPISEDKMSFAFKNIASLDVSNARYLKIIGSSAFTWNQISGELDLSNTNLTTIGAEAFAVNSINLLKLSDRITNIGSGAFNYNQLKDEDAFIYKRTDNNSDGIAEIDNTTLVSYAGARKENLVFPSNIEKIEKLFDCYELNYNKEKVSGSLDLSQTKIKTINDSFFACKITNVKLPDTLEIISDRAFWNNQIEGTLDLSNLVNLREIGTKAFLNNQITNLKLPNSVTTINEMAFEGNQIRGELDLSNLTNLTTIGNYAFQSNQITSVKLPNSITSIDDGAFNYNSNLTLIEIDNTKDAIEGAPWGADNAIVKWLRDSE